MGKQLVHRMWRISTHVFWTAYVSFFCLKFSLKVRCHQWRHQNLFQKKATFSCIPHVSPFSLVSAMLKCFFSESLNRYMKFQHRDSVIFYKCFISTFSVFSVLRIEKLFKDIMASQYINLWTKIKRNQKGLLSVFGAFLLQLCAGSYHGTFGNLLPYLTSYLRKVKWLLFR